MLCCNIVHEVCDYASMATYRECPNIEQIRAGVVPLDSLPAAWWNWMWWDTNKAVNEARDAVGVFVNEFNTLLSCAGITPNCTCVDQVYRAIEKIRTTIGNAVTAGSVKSSSGGGQVTIEEDGTMTMNGVGNAANLTTTAHTIVGAINELNTSKAPVGHASTATTYGVGNADCYGHLKISDTYDSCIGGAAAGLAASQAALYNVYSAISGAGYTTLGNTAGCALGTAAAGTATTAARSDHVHPIPSCVIDKYGSSAIGIGYACAGLTCAQLTNLAAFSTSYTSGCTVIKNVSKATVQCWLGLGGAAYCAATAFRPSTWTPSCVACAGTVGRTGYATGYNFDVALTNNCVSAAGTTLYVSAACRLRFCNTTGVLYATCFCGAAASAASAVAACHAYCSFCLANSISHFGCGNYEGQGICIWLSNTSNYEMRISNGSSCPALFYSLHTTGHTNIRYFCFIAPTQVCSLGSCWNCGASGSKFTKVYFLD